MSHPAVQHVLDWQGSDAADLCRRLEPALVALAPRDLTEIYVVPQSALPGDEQRKVAGTWCEGYTSPWLTAILRPYIPHWRGPAPLIVLNDVASRKLAIAYGRTTFSDTSPEIFLYRIIDSAIHETAHCLARERLFCNDPPPPGIEECIAAKLIADDLAPPSGAGAACPFSGHGPEFIRAAVHLTERARRLGFDTLGYGVACGEDYAVSTLPAYRDALRPELDALPSVSIPLLLTLPEPEPFTRLWLDDMQAWNERNPTR